MAESLALRFGNDLSGNSALTIKYGIAETGSSSSAYLTYITPSSGWSVMYITMTSGEDYPILNSSAFYTGGSIQVSAIYIYNNALQNTAYSVSDGIIGSSQRITVSYARNSRWTYFII